MSQREPSEILENLESCQVILKEKQYLQPVLVQRVELSDWGVKCELRSVVTTGFNEATERLYTIGSTWEQITVTNRVISAWQIGWMMVIRPEDVQSIIKAALKGMSASELRRLVDDLAFT